MMPGVAPAPINYSYTPPVNMMGGAVPAATVPAPATQPPMWQPGQPLIPTQQPGLQMPQVLPQMPQMLPQAIPQVAAYPEQTKSFIPFPQPVAQAPVVEYAQPVAQAPIQYAQAPQVVETFAQPPIYQQPQVIQAAPQVIQAAPTMVEQVPAPMATTVAAAPVAAPAVLAEAFQPAPITLPVQAPQVIQAAPVIQEQIRMPSVPTVAPVTYAAQPIQQYQSYIPAQPQTASYIPAAAPVMETVTAQPQVASYIPAAQPVVETIGAPQVASYIPAAQPAITYAQPAVTYAQPSTVVETLSPGIATTVAQPVSYIPPAVVQQPQIVESGNVVSYVQPAAQVVEPAAPSGQSVIVEQVGDWLVCEDALGVFYHHTPTQQSFDNAPAEFLALFPQGYTPPPLGAFAAAGYGAAATPAPAPVIQQAMPQVSSYIPAAQTVQTIAAPQVTYAAAPVMETVMQPQQVYTSYPQFVQ